MKRIGKWLGITFLGLTVLIGISGRRISELMGYAGATADKVVEQLEDSVPAVVRDQKLQNDIETARGEIIDRRVKLNLAASEVRRLQDEVGQLTAAGQRRAVKVLIDPSSNTAKQSFQREWRILDSKELPGRSDVHPLVAPQFYFCDETAGAQPFLVIEWIDGHNVEDFIGNRPTLPPEQREALCEQILLAYGRLHAANILHRDVSLRNIMIQPPTPGHLRDKRLPAECVRLIDFGSGCRKDQGYAEKNSLSSVPITEGFASDQMKARETRGSVADEVHAVARVCFYVLTGQRSDRIAPEQWRSTLMKFGIDRHLIDRTILPRMQQPQ